MQKLKTRITHTLLAITGPDPRSLTLFRVVLALGVLLDLWERFVNLPYFYSEDGLLPRALWEGEYGDLPYYWTLHFLGGSSFLVGALIVFQMALALALLFGFRTRWAAALSWLLLLSLVLRNPLTFYGGDKLAPILLLIGAFLPLSRRLQRTSLTSFVSRMAFFWLLLQMAILYIASGQSKLGSVHWLDGSALENILQMSTLVRPLGTWFGHVPLLPPLLSWATPWAEMILPLFFFVPFWRGRLRALAVLVLLGLNLGIQMMLEVGFFMAYASAGLLALLPAQFWDDLAGVWRRLPRLRDVPLKRLSSVFGADALGAVVVRRQSHLGRIVSALAALLMAAFMLVTLATGLEGMRFIRLTYPPPSWTVVRGLNVYQNWGLFTHPTPTASWHASKARLADDTWVDILQAGAPVVWDYPNRPNALFRESSKWRVALAKIGSLDNEDLFEATGRTLVRVWNDVHPPEKAAETLTVYSFSQPLPVRGDTGRTWRVWLEWPPSVSAN